MWIVYLVIVFQSFLCSVELLSQTDVGFPAVNERQLSEVKNRNLKGLEIEAAKELEIYSGWEKFITPGPLTVAVLGQLIVIGNKKDFPLAEGRNSYKYIRHKYFRPTMIQISNEAWFAFHEAHRSMNKIRLYMLSIPNYAKTSLKFLSSGSPEVVKKFLPIPLNAIGSAALECVKLANRTQVKFLEVYKLLSEVDEALSTTQSVRDTELEELKSEIIITEIHKKKLEELQTFTKQRLENVTAELAEDRRKFEEAISDIPTGFEAVFLGLLSKINPMELFNPTRFEYAGSRAQPTWETSPEQAEQFTRDQIVLTFAETFYNAALNMSAELDDWSDRTNKAGGNRTGGASDIENYLLTKAMAFRAIKERLSSKTSKWTQKVVDLFEKAIKMADDLRKKARESGGLDEQALAEAKSKINFLISDAKSLVATKNSLLGTSVRQNSGPSDPDTVGANERYIAAMREQKLAQTTQRYDTAFKDVLHINRELNELLVKMARLDLSRASYEEIRKIIKEAIVAIARLKKQWNKLMGFFEIIYSVSSVNIKQTVDYFVSMTDVAGQAVLQLGSPALAYVVDDLGIQMIRISTYSRFLYTLSHTYVNVSDTCIMGSLAGISELQTIEDPAQQQRELQQLFDKSKDAQEKIKRLAEANMKSFHAHIRAERKDIQGIYAIVGQPTADDRRALEVAKEDLKDYKEADEPKFNLDCPMC